ncbi:MAG: Type-2 restriction enzyme BsuMI component YdiS [Firmicutes bacterium ADurb.Bin193]|nr:MAG: Type-2 restriction enzyme BsuMI component YdiS [Firmicutes bacterium ADurb.Bin193]
MEFNEAIQIVCSTLAATGTVVSADDYDGIIVKKLVASNTLDDERTTNQTHIAITGSQMDIFPYLRSEGYLTGNEDVPEEDLKKYFVGKIPVDLYSSNIEYLSGGEETGIVFQNGKRRTNTSIVRSKRREQADQIQVSLLSFDGPDFVTFRQLLHIGTYMVILKKKNALLYDFFGVIPNRAIDGDGDLQSINNQLFIRPTNTAVDIAELTTIHENDDVNTTIAVGGCNKIFYGAPGCGKSRYVSDMLANANVSNDNIVRVTFHPEYSNVDFLGQILPTVESDQEGNDIVKYTFNPGSFSIALLKAYNSTSMVYLIIEEINRGNAAAIFGDMFQLLDRVRDVSSAKYSASEYPINNPNMQKYLIERVQSQEIRDQLQNGIYIPSNLTIFATMNSSDQNVFTLDTAFKRRWNFEQISNDITRDTEHSYKGMFIPGTDITWETFLTKINDKILDYKIHTQTNEDKRLGKYFVTQDCLTAEGKNIADVQDEAMAFAYKVLEYLWNDVCKIGREDWFDTEKYRTLEELISAFIAPKNGSTPLSVFQNISF